MRTALAHALRILLRLFYTCSPVATSVPQFYHLKRSAKDGFSSATCLVLLVSSVLRIAFWVGRRLHDAAFLAYSVLTTLMQLLLLDAIVSAKRKKRSAGTASSRRLRQHNDMRHSALGAAVRKTAKALAGGDFRQANEVFKNEIASSFWGWDELKPYVEVLVVFIVLVIGVSIFALRYEAYKTAIGFFGALAEALVGLPQLWENWRRKDTAGLSPVMVLLWLSGDFLKYSYYKSTDLPSFATLTLAQVACDATLLAQIALYSAPCAKNAKLLSSCKQQRLADKAPPTSSRLRDLWARIFRSQQKYTLVASSPSTGPPLVPPPPVSQPVAITTTSAHKDLVLDTIDLLDESSALPSPTSDIIVPPQQTSPSHEKIKTTHPKHDHV